MSFYEAKNKKVKLLECPIENCSVSHFSSYASRKKQPSELSHWLGLQELGLKASYIRITTKVVQVTVGGVTGESSLKRNTSLNNALLVIWNTFVNNFDLKNQWVFISCWKWKTHWPSKDSIQLRYLTTHSLHQNILNTWM